VTGSEKRLILLIGKGNPSAQTRFVTGLPHSLFIFVVIVYDLVCCK
jgi:hypothetical protein